MHIIENVMYIKFDEMLYILDLIHDFDDEEYKIIILDDYMI